MRDPIRSLLRFVDETRSTVKFAQIPHWARISAILFGLLVLCWFLLRDPGPDSPKVETISAMDRITFHSHWEIRFPSFRKYFVHSAKQHNIDWTLLSVIGYQESKWAEDAISPTGVRGIMMLTRATAKEIGVADRTDPKQSIAGGAYYLNYLLRKAPRELDLEGRRWFAVSAYNGGIGRMRIAYKGWRRQSSSAPNWYDFEHAMLNITSDPLVRTALLYTKRVRDYHLLATRLADNE